MKVWNVTTGELLTLIGHTGWVAGVAFSLDGQRIASANFGHAVKLWDVTTGEELLTLKGLTDWVDSVAFSPDNLRIASGGGSDLKVWDARPWTPELRAEQEAISVVRFLFGEGLSNDDVLKTIAADATINDAVRNRALGLAREWRKN